MSLRRIFGLILLFLFFQAAVAVLVAVLLPDVNVLLACAVMTGLALLVWALIVLVNGWSKRQSEKPAPEPLQPAPSAKPAAVADDAFAARLKALIREADSRLAASPSAAEQVAKPAVANLPLYLVVGPPGVGKTATLQNSGVEPRLLAGEASRDSAVVPTELCNLWFAAGAVFADLSGRVFLDEPDHWEALVRLLMGRQKSALWKRILRGGSPRQNLKGVLLFCDAKDYLRGGDPQKAVAYSRQVQERLQTIGNLLGCDFPVYALVTKSDSIPYFGEFFAHLSDTEDQRILGATLPLVRTAGRVSAEVYVESENRRLSEYFNGLYGSLADKRMLMLARETSSPKKPLVYEFPRELKRLRGELIAFLVDVFRPNPLQGGPRLRGFYFSGVRSVVRTKAVEEVAGEFSVAHSASDATVFFGGGSAERLLEAFPLPAPAGPSGPAGTVQRWAFVAELFNSIITRDHVAPAGAPMDRRIELYRTLALGLTSLLFLVLCFAWTISWSKNRTLLDDMESAAAAVSKTVPAAPALENLQEMESLRSRIERLERYDRDGAPLSMRWGLYAGNRTLPPLRDLYFDRFRKLFLDRILASFSSQFSSSAPAATASYSDVYSQLKIYRMTTSGDCGPNKAALDATLPTMWPWSASLPPEEAALAARQIRFYISELMVRDPYQRQIPEDPAVVKQARAYLQGLGGPDKLLRGLIERLNREKEPVAVSQYASNYREVLNGPDRVEYAYTAAGWETIRKRIHDRSFGSAEEPCVVGAGAVLASWAPGSNLDGDLEARYVRDYIPRWKQFLAGQEVLPYQNIADAAHKLAIVSDSNRSPLLAILFLVSSNTNFHPVEKSALEQTAQQAAEGGLSRFLPRIGRAQQEVKKLSDSPPAPPQPTVADVARAFQPVQAAVSPANPDRWLNDANRAYVTALAELADALRAMGPKPDPVSDQPAYDQAYKAVDKAWAAARQLEQAFNNTPEQIDLDLRHFVEAPLANLDAVLPRNRTAPLVGQLNGAARGFCAKFDRLRRRYPFAPKAQEEVGIDELTKLLAPGTGELARFVLQPPMASFLTRQGGVWMQNPAAAQPRLSPRFLESLNELTRFSEMLFPHGGTQPALEYTVSLNASSPINFELQADGRTIAYSGRPTEPVKLSWPGSTPGAKLIVRSGLTLPSEGPGLWGIFRLLDRAENPRPGVFIFSKITFAGSEVQLQDAKSQPVTLQIQVDSAAASLFSQGRFWRIGCAGLAVQ